MVFKYFIFFLCFLLSSQQEADIIKILTNKSSSSPCFYINASFDKSNSIILPLKIELNTLTTSVLCDNFSPNKYGLNLTNLSKDLIISCSDNLCYKLFFNEEICDQSSQNKCSYINLFKNDFNKKNISGIYIKNYFNIFMNDIRSSQKSNILPIGCIKNNFNAFNESITAGVFSLGGDSYSFLAHFYKENNFRENNSFFSICLDPIEGGFLTFGNLIDKYHLNNDLPISFNYHIKDSYYLFEINNMFFNHENFNKDEYKATLNINNEYTYINNEIINNLFNLFKNFLKKDLLKKY